MIEYTVVTERVRLSKSRSPHWSVNAVSGSAKVETRESKWGSIT